MFVKTMMKISEEDYNKLLQYSKEDKREDIYEFVVDMANNSSFKPCGYDFSNPSFYEEDGKYFVSWNRWSSCD